MINKTLATVVSVIEMIYAIKPIEVVTPPNNPGKPDFLIVDNFIFIGEI